MQIETHFQLDQSLLATPSTRIQELIHKGNQGDDDAKLAADRIT